jgi:hypothetical protein
MSVRAAAISGLFLGTVLLLAGTASGGGTGPSGLATIQGSGAATSQGDYTTADGGLDTYYSYYAEVPPGLSRLDVDLFDADVGDGTNEDDANRDRDRGGFNTTATYTLRAPNGSLVSTRFSTGTTTLPAGGDNAWLTFFSSTGTFRDEFNAVSYSNNNGTNAWSTSWDETGDNGDADDPGDGEIRIVSDGGNNRLRIENSNRSVQREVNLNGMTSATLSFVYRRVGLDNNSDYVAVEASSNGGGSWTELDRFAGAANDGGYTAASYDLTPYIATNTRIRFRSPATLGNGDIVYFDNVEISFSGPVAGHWELRVAQASTGDDINALGVRAHDGNSGSGGTEVNVYQHSYATYGTNNPPFSRSYTHHPYITSGCLLESNTFDWDSNSGATGSLVHTSRSGSFAQNIGTLSENDDWQNTNVGPWTSDTNSTEYGIWSLGVTVNGYPGNANYGVVYLGNTSAANTPTAQPQANTFRIYLPNDAGAAPAKPYLEQQVRHTGCGTNSGPNPPQQGQTTCYTVTVRLVNPAAQAVTFSTPSNIVTANVPGGAALYGGGAQVSQGSIVSQPAVGGSGNVTWNPGSLAAGATALLSYRLNVTPTSPGQRVLLTATPASGNGTRAQFVDETGNTTQARATYLAGPVCELAVTEDVLTPAVVTGLTAQTGPEGVVVQWETASEVGTAGFELQRWDAARRAWEPVNRALLPALLGSPQGGRYRLVDEGADPSAPLTYRVVEVEGSGSRRAHGPYRVRVESERGGRGKALDRFEGSSEAWKTRAVVSAASAPARKPREERAAALKIGVEEPGLYFVPAGPIATILGVKPDKLEKQIAGGRLKLENRGEEVAWIPAEGNAGILFFGEAIESVHTRENVYRLSDAKGLRMKTSPGGSPAPVAEPLLFTDTIHAEQDRLGATVVAADPEADFWFWEYLNAGGATDGARSFSVSAPEAGGAGTARLRVGLQGATATGTAEEHHAVIRINGTEVGEARWTGLAAHEAELEFDQALLLPGANTIEIVALLEPGVPYSIFYVDSFDLTYTRSFQAAGDALPFRGGGHASVTLGGFADPRIDVFDVTDPLNPRRLVGPTVDGAAGNARVSLAPAAGREYLAVSPAGWRSPRISGDAASQLRVAGQGADYLVVAPRALLAAARELAGLREAQGLEVAVVDVEDVYDEFSDGLADPRAIRDFLAWTWSRWSPAPRYAVLAGKGSFDERDNLGLGGNLLPPFLTRTPDGLFAADNRYGDVNGDGVPEIAVGRLPVRTAAELSALVAKIAAYEAAPPADWSGRALLVSDDPEGGVDFAADGGLLAAAVPGGYETETISLSPGGLEGARAALLDALGAGAGVLSYLGHGALDRLAAEGLLTSADVAGLGNGSRLPVVAALTCIINRFEVPGFAALGEELVRAPGAGAAAVWAPSGLSSHAEARDLGAAFLRELGRPPGERVERIGDAIRRALQAHAVAGGLATLLDVYNLLGDPALLVKRPPPASTPGGGTPGVE